MVRIAFCQDHFSCITWKNRKEQDRRLLQSSRQVIMNAQGRGELVENRVENRFKGNLEVRAGRSWYLIRYKGEKR